jgi:hypothetical protein
MPHQIENEWNIDYINKRIYVDDGRGWPDGTVVFTVNKLYSWLQNEFDEQGQMDDEVPMSAQTPTAYTMINGWFIDDESAKYLKQGAITTSGNDDDIMILEFQSAGKSNDVGSDYTNVLYHQLGRTVTGQTTGHTGKLLAYDNSLRKWWVRADTPGTDLFNAVEEIIITEGGSGVTARDATTGESLWTNIYTLGTVTSDPAPHIYVGQKRETISRWWPRGHMDILVKVGEAQRGSVIGLIDDGEVTVYVREFGDLFDHFGIDLSAGGRNAIPVSTANDLNNETGEAYLIYKRGRSYTGYTTEFADGDIIEGETSGATAEVYSLVISGGPDDDTTGVLEIGNIIGTFQHQELIVNADLDARAQTQGTVGETYFAYDGEGGGADFDEGDWITVDDSGSDTTATLRGHIDQLAGDTGWMVVGNPTGSFADNANISNRLSSGAKATGLVDGAGVETVDSYVDYDDIQIAFVNGYLPYTGKAGTFTEGETVQGSDSKATAIMLEDEGTSLVLGNVESGDIATHGVGAGGSNSLGPFRDGETVTGLSSAAACTVDNKDGLVPTDTINKRLHATQPYYPYNVVIDLNNWAGANGRTVAEMYEYLKRITREDSGSNNLDKRIYTHESRRRTLTFRGDSISGGYTPMRPGDVGGIVTGSDTGYSGELISYDNTQREWIVLQDAYGDYFDTSEMIEIDGGFHKETEVGRLFGAATIDPIYGQHYEIGYDGFTVVKQSPFGTFAGGVFFGAQGVWIQNMDSGDTQNYQLLDANGNTRTPPNFQSLSITSVVVGDRCAIFRDDGSGNVEKNTYTSDGTEAYAFTQPGTDYNWFGNMHDATTFRVSSTITTDVPEVGYLRVVRRNAAGDIQSEERYEYESWSNVGTPAWGIFLLGDGEPPGGGDSPPKRLVHPLGHGNGYDNNDTAYVPYIDEQAAAVSVSVTVIYTANIDVIARVRLKGILPFESSGTFGSTGYTVAAIRTTDTIVT